MTPKSVIILAAAAALGVAAAAAALKANHGYTVRTAGGPVFPGLIDKIDAVAKVQVNHNKGETVVTRGDEGVWMIAASDGHPADLGQVQKSILQLAQLRYLEKKTAKKKLYERLHLQDIDAEDSDARRIRLFDAKNAPVADLIVGKKRYNLPGAVTEGAYIRKPSDPQTWLASGEINVETSLKSWLRNSILNIREEDVLEVEIRHPDGEIVKISKADPKAPNFTLHEIPEGKKLRYDSDPNTIASVVENLEMEDARRADKIDFAAAKTVRGTYTLRSGLMADLAVVKAGGDDWLKVKLTAKPDAPAPKEKGKETAAEIAKRVTGRTGGWAFKIPGFKAERLRRDAAEMLVDKKAGS